MAKTQPIVQGKPDYASMSPAERRAYLRSGAHLSKPAFRGIDTAAVVGSPAHARVTQAMDAMGMTRAASRPQAAQPTTAQKVARAAQASLQAAAPAARPPLGGAA